MDGLFCYQEEGNVSIRAIISKVCNQDQSSWIIFRKTVMCVCSIQAGELVELRFHRWIFHGRVYISHFLQFSSINSLGILRDTTLSSVFNNSESQYFATRLDSFYASTWTVIERKIFFRRARSLWFKYREIFKGKVINSRKLDLDPIKLKHWKLLWILEFWSVDKK